MPELSDVLNTFWTDLMARPDGPYSFRFILQPLMATILAILDGIKDARTGRSPYFWTIVNDPAKRAARLREGIRATARILLLAVVLEGVPGKRLPCFPRRGALVIVFVLVSALSVDPRPGGRLFW